MQTDPEIWNEKEHEALWKGASLTWGKAMRNSRIFLFLFLLFFWEVSIAQPISTCNKDDSFRIVKSSDDCKNGEIFTVLNAGDIDDSKWKPSNFIALAGVCASLLGFVLGIYGSSKVMQRQIDHDKSGRLLEQRVKTYSEYIDSFLDLNQMWKVGKMDRDSDVSEAVQSHRQSIALIATEGVREESKAVYAVFDKFYRAENEKNVLLALHNNEKEAIDEAVKNYRSAVRTEFDVG